MTSGRRIVLVVEAVVHVAVVLDAIARRTQRGALSERDIEHAVEPQRAFVPELAARFAAPAAEVRAPRQDIDGTAVAFRPYSVPCGPFRTSMRSRS